MEREKEAVEHEAIPEALIRTPRMQIRRFAQSEWMRLLAYLQDDGIADSFPEGAYTERRLRDMTADPHLYALVSEEDDEVMGHAFCRPGVQPLTGELGIGVRSDYRRHGYAGEAFRALLAHSFGELGLHRLTVTCPPENLALRALLEKTGMRMEGFFRQSLPTADGEWKDECVYALLRDEWRVQERLLEMKEEELTAVETENEAAFETRIAASTAAPETPDIALANHETRQQEEERTKAETVVLTKSHEASQTADTVVQDSAADANEPELQPAQPEFDPNVPQVTFATGEAGGPGPFAPVLPPLGGSVEPAASAEAVTVLGTVVGVQRAVEPDPLGGLIEQRIDGVPFLLRRPHDFNWLAPFGVVFRVWDRQDSGNIAFGLKIEDQQVFIKYAGAATADYEGHPVDAVRRLREAANVYEILEHPTLVRLLDHFETEDGYAMLFEWTEGELLRRDDAPSSPISRFRRLPIEERIDAVERILDFHAHVEAFGYVAIDFYDGSLIYDFERKRITICDIDFYSPAPYTNEMGRMWGSSRFMSPEEHERGAAIDSRTNVYGLGAMAFCLLGSETDRSRERWEAGEALFELAARAVSLDRSERWETVAELLEAWRAAR
ncbi:hypothetical protein GCM10007362_25800 [Saccharibacillus endophyticus]|uniref:GNAT family N-acetyltransferase n=1 Tax=Saccharibacillus endophyticus TaxID=2060666 RepID=A0ABQ1ZUV3_9BACL|nr:hypothetical protein GCM10007362_25800 [Saccharibacillus endophyticus]